ncbi:MAG: hypothetical protein HFF44_08530 [Lawsonibacter sp.]|nr:hypothetical protein [Lawsonibacter sp.]
MSISAIQNSGVYQAPEVQKAQPASVAPGQAEAIQRQLDQVNRELAQKDNDAYRRQHAVFS